MSYISTFSNANREFKMRLFLELELIFFSDRSESIGEEINIEILSNFFQMEIADLVLSKCNCFQFGSLASNSD